MRIKQYGWPQAGMVESLRMLFLNAITTTQQLTITLYSILLRKKDTKNPNTVISPVKL